MIVAVGIVVLVLAGVLMWARLFGTPEQDAHCSRGDLELDRQERLRRFGGKSW